MRSQNNLNDFRNKVDLYLDNALSTEESQELINKTKSDPNCKAVLEKESNFRSLIKNNVKRTTCSDSLIQNILNKVKL